MNVLSFLFFIACGCFIFGADGIFLPSEQKGVKLGPLPQSQPFGDIPQVKVSVYYESLCPDSQYFVVDQLAPTFKRLPSLVKTDLVPYGKATTTEVNNDYKFTCQHGEIECQGNIYHSCVIKHVKDQGTALEVVQCMISNNIDPAGIALQCCETYGVNFTTISRCAEGKEGRRLLKYFGDRTKNDLSPPLAFVPTVLINGERRNQPLVLKNLFKEICAYYRTISKVPRECDT
ncbi:gamma-interferon-inducible lysosomal thiol reductase-like isoform X2 [Cimex lectularius]|uniref:Gamma-interferon inducible lysosomal thiol reductase n=1 Tax=Cimex lectularius TaxID=79782 RepID=A0A8I6RG16_CIMLE|nr:gamma-interferon-inducible lysosomal thiol reductase-like isoform X2 [Cimex lectularius]